MAATSCRARRKASRRPQNTCVVTANFLVIRAYMSLAVCMMTIPIPELRFGMQHLN
jgi:hypothetical protein